MCLIRSPCYAAGGASSSIGSSCCAGTYCGTGGAPCGPSTG
ncbi:hypothetical protein A2U01_0092385, partial [Trifolium medium]|nr:hypothetical protein [Trifolium medium]